MKQQRIDRAKPAKAPEIIDTRQPNVPEPPTVDPAVANLPLRTVFYMEVGDMEQKQIQLLIQHVNELYSGSKGGIHYVIPIRHGKVGSDIMFEQEFLRVVKEMCEIKDGEIVLKDGAQEATILRHTI